MAANIYQNIMSALAVSINFTSTNDLACHKHFKQTLANILNTLEQKLTKHETKLLPRHFGHIQSIRNN